MFASKVSEVLLRDKRYAAQGYAFLCDALAYTVRMTEREGVENRHVSGQELLQGFRELALQEFGPMALVVMHDWGIHRSEDVGNMVFNLIDVAYFGRSENDRLEDFSDGVSLTEFLRKPYQKISRS